MAPNQSRLFSSIGFDKLAVAPACSTLSLLSRFSSRALMLCTLCSMLSSERIGLSALLPEQVEHGLFSLASFPKLKGCDANPCDHETKITAFLFCVWYCILSHR